MLQSLELENFKAFGERARIPFAPITLIFGENSAGKSTILQALNLLKQTRESREAGALLLPRTESGIADLGSFQEMLFDHNPKKILSIRVTTKKERELAIEFKFKRSSRGPEVLLVQIGIYDGKSSKHIATFRPSGSTIGPEEFWMGVGFFRSSSGLLPSKVTPVKCVRLTKAAAYWKPEFEWCRENKDEIISQLNDEKSDLEDMLKHRIDGENSSERERSDDESQRFVKKLREDLDSLGIDIEFFSSDFDLKTYISERYKEKVKTVLGVEGFLPVGIISSERNPVIARSHSILSWKSDDPAFDIAQLAMVSGHALEQTLTALFPMGPFRRAPERWYIFRGTSPQDVGYRGDLLPDLLFRRPELVEEANEWLKRLDMGYELEVKPVGTDSNDLFELRLIDTRRKERVNVALSDVGFGISQLLPFVVQCLVSEKQIISIEQPEVHVHPRLQADLGELLAEAIKEPRQNRFIVETHSEHLILRLQRLVRKKFLKPEDISVIYISRGPEGAESRRLRLDEGGNFIDNWPKGFFLERLRELR